MTTCRKEGNLNKSSSITLRFLAEPGDANFGGKVHGGAVMKWIDHAGYACASAWSGCYCVTAHIGSVNFINPIHIGNIVEVKAAIIHTGRSSMHIAVDVRAGDPRGDSMQRTTQCVMVFVAVDGNGQTVSVPSWVPETDREKKLQEYAIHLAELKESVKQETRRYLEEW